MTGGDLHTLTGAYAVGAVTGPEAEEFRRHLLECDACRQEVRELRATAARLALAVAVPPPADLRERVMAALPGVRQLPPVVAEVAALAPARRGRRQRLPYLAAAACVALAAVTTGVAVRAEHRTDREHARAVEAERQAAALSGLLTAPDARSGTGSLTGGGTATVVASARLGRAAVLFHDLPALSDSRVYELWYSRGGTMVRAGLVEAGRSSGSLLLDGRPEGAAGVGVTAEPAGGSDKPTGAPLAVLPL